MKLFLKAYTAVVVLLLGFFAGTKVLPYYFSGQKNLTEKSFSGLYSPDEKSGEFHGNKFTSPYIPPQIAYNRPIFNPNVLGAYRADKRIEIDLTNQRLYAYEGNNKIYDFLISSGKWGRTPTGEFTIWTKLRYTKMEGGNKALNTYYYLPNVPFTMFFYNDDIPTWRGFGIHGTYWHSNFGHPMSHGCINMKTEEVEKIYFWAQPDLPGGKLSTRATPENPGTRVVIYGKAP